MNIKSEAPIFYRQSARAASFASLFCLFTNYSLVLILNDYASEVRHLVMPEMLLWSSLGMLAGGFLCPFFLPLPCKDLPDKKKPKAAGIIFILVAMIPNIVMRSFGVEFWLGFLAVRSFVHFFTGMLYPVCCGLFIYSFVISPNAQPKLKDRKLDSKNRTGIYCVFLFSIAWSSIIFNRYIALPMFEFLGFGTDTLISATIAYNIITVLMACVLIFVIASLILLDKAADRAELSFQEPTLQAETVKTNWNLIILLISLTLVYQITNTLLEMRFHSLSVTYIAGTEFFSFLSMAVIVIILGFFAGLSINKFLRLFLPFAIISFILLPCLILFDNDPPYFIIILRNITGMVFYRVLSAVFTVAIVEQYLSVCDSKRAGSKRWSGFWFYMLAGYFNITNIFLYFSRNVGGLIPAGSGYTVLIISIAAVAFMLLSIKIIFPNFPVQNNGLPAINQTKLEDIFREYGLTENEMEVAALVVNEGLSNEKIAERLFRSVDAIKARSTGIYSKFKVKNRVELMAAVVKKMNAEQKAISDEQ